MKSPDSSQILIASCAADAPTWEPVARSLIGRGYDVLPLETDKIALGQIPFALSVTNEAGLVATYGSDVISTRQIRSGWFRRTAFISDTNDYSQAQADLEIERQAIQIALWDAIPDDSWLNSPKRMRHASQKLTQLALAQQMGFTIPDTVSSNSWNHVQQIQAANIIYKASRSMFRTSDGPKTLFTTPFANDPETLPIDSNPYPGIWQPLLPKGREWRITVVGDVAFDAAIYTSNEAKDDWRRYQHNDAAVEFKSESFPDIEKEKCFRFLGELGLRFGAFDFIESPDGGITFLECNPNGQFMWIEYLLEHPISQAIADELATMASRHTD